MGLRRESIGIQKTQPLLNQGPTPATPTPWSRCRFGSRHSGASMSGRVLLSYGIVVRHCTSFELPAHVRIACDCLRSAPHYSTPVDAWSRVCRPQPITLTRDIATSGLLSSKPECLRSECLSGSAIDRFVAILERLEGCWSTTPIDDDVVGHRVQPGEKRLAPASGSARSPPTRAGRLARRGPPRRSDWPSGNRRSGRRGLDTGHRARRR